MADPVVGLQDGVRDATPVVLVLQQRAGQVLATGLGMGSLATGCPRRRLLDTARSCRMVPDPPAPRVLGQVRRVRMKFA